MTIKDLFRIWLILISIVIIWYIADRMTPSQYTNHNYTVEFSCVDGFWQITIDQKTQPIFIQPDGVIIPLVCN